MKKRIKEILIITSICCATLFATTGCGLCYSCGRSAPEACLNGCVGSVEGCFKCASCIGCDSFCQGCLASDLSSSEQ